LWQAAVVATCNVAGTRPYIIGLSPQPQRVKVLLLQLLMLLPLPLLPHASALLRVTCHLQLHKSIKTTIAKWQARSQRDAVDPDKLKRKRLAKKGLGRRVQLHVQGLKAHAQHVAASPAKQLSHPSTVPLPLSLSYSPPS